MFMSVPAARHSMSFPMHFSHRYEQLLYPSNKNVCVCASSQTWNVLFNAVLSQIQTTFSSIKQTCSSQTWADSLTPHYYLNSKCAPGVQTDDNQRLQGQGCMWDAVGSKISISEWHGCSSHVKACIIMIEKNMFRQSPLWWLCIAHLVILENLCGNGICKLYEKCACFHRQWHQSDPPFKLLMAVLGCSRAHHGLMFTNLSMYLSTSVFFFHKCRHLHRAIFMNFKKFCILETKKSDDCSLIHYGANR